MANLGGLEHYRRYGYKGDLNIQCVTLQPTSPSLFHFILCHFILFQFVSFYFVLLPT
jgi:hypothetical protein